MERVSIQEIAGILVEKSNLKKKEAELFVSTMFELVKEGLANDRIVKIKGLGTFKIVDIEARESVNVNTGERVLIEGHDKITFTPDATMKELVNKPFSQFETVVLNEGVTFDDMNDVTPTEEDAPAVEEVAPAVEKDAPAVEEDAPAVEEVAPAVEEVAPAVEEVAPIVEFVSAVEDVPAEEETPTEEDVPTEEEVPAVPTEEVITEESLEPEEYMSKKMTYISLVVAIIVCILSFAAGYYLRGVSGAAVVPDEVKAEQGVLPADSAAADTTKRDTIKKAERKDTLLTETPAQDIAARKEAKPEVKPEVKPETKPEVKPEVKPAPEVSSDKYEQMDNRVRTGAYRIVGTDHQVKVKAGETLALISRRALGPDMECYVEVYNGLKSSSALTEGQTIKIPKLELKKKKKVNN